MIIALILSLAAAAQPTRGARAEAQVTATIQRGVMVRGGIASSRDTGIAVRRSPPRNCTAHDGTGPKCRLIVFDLP
jgi:hypothetical protein